MTRTTTPDKARAKAREIADQYNRMKVPARIRDGWVRASVRVAVELHPDLIPYRDEIQAETMELIG